MRMMGLAIVAAGLVGVAGFAVSGRLDGRGAPPAYRQAAIEKGTLAAVVAATGTVNPVATVVVGSQVSGQIREIMADFNSEVAKGDVIARIDPDSFAIRVEQANADLEVARSQVAVQEGMADRARADLEAARAALLAAKASVAKAQVAVTAAGREQGRKKSLYESGTGAAGEAERAQDAYDTALAARREAEAEVHAKVAAVAAAEAALRTAEAQCESARTVVAQREVGLRQSRIDFERTRIRAPVDGTVIARDVDAGQTVAASLQAPVLFKIAQDLRQMQVEVAVDEADIGRVSPGLPVTFSVDAHPGRTFRGEVRQIRMAPQVVQNVVTYTVIASADNPDLALLPGMTATVGIIVAQREAVLQVPNAALRFTPPDAAPMARKGGGGHLWVPDPAGRPVAVTVQTGISDGVTTEVAGPDLSEGLPVIVGLDGELGAQRRGGPQEGMSWLRR